MSWKRVIHRVGVQHVWMERHGKNNKKTQTDCSAITGTRRKLLEQREAVSPPKQGDKGVTDKETQAQRVVHTDKKRYRQPDVERKKTKNSKVPNRGNVSPDTRSLALLPWFLPSCPGFPRQAATPAQGRLGCPLLSLERLRSLGSETVYHQKTAAMLAHSADFKVCDGRNASPFCSSWGPHFDPPAAEVEEDKIHLV